MVNGSGGREVIVSSFRQAYCPAPMLACVSTGMRFLAFGAIPLGALLAGGLGSVLPVRIALWVVLAVYALSGTLLLTRVFRRDKNLPGEPGAAGGAAAARSPERENAPMTRQAAAMVTGPPHGSPSR